MHKNTIIALFMIVIISILISFFIPLVKPETLIGLVLCLLIGLISFFKIEFGIYILIFSMLLSPEIKIGDVPGRAIIVRADDLIFIVILFVWFSRVAISKEIRFLKHTPLNPPLLIYSVICVIFTLKGVLLEDVYYIKGFFFVLKYIQYFLIFFLVVNICKDEKDVKKYLIAGLITCIIVVIYGYIQIIAGVRVSAPFETAIGERVQSGEPGTIGVYFVIVFGILLGCFLYISKVTTKIRVLLFFLSMLPPFLQTLSRASYISFAVLFLTAFVLAKKHKLLLLTILFFSLIFLPIILPENVINRIQETFKGKTTVEETNVKLDASSIGRIESWTMILKEKLPNHFLTGYGITGVGFVDGQYFRILGELGVIGLGVFIWMLVTIFKIGWRLYNIADNEFTKSLAFGYIIGFVGLLANAITTNTFMIVRVMEPFWFMTALIMVLYEQKLTVKKAAEKIPLTMEKT
ncbi:MAG: hypothetical protein ABH873_06560 [Candidatus Firestonebacteria bacterium]